MELSGQRIFQQDMGVAGHGCVMRVPLFSARLLTPVVGTILVGALCVGGSARAAGDWSVSVYGAKNSPDRLVDILFRPPPEMRSSWLYAMALGHVFYHGAGFQLEAEFQLVRHTGMQDHFESNAVWLGRWKGLGGGTLPGFNLALGQGLSHAFRTPPIEPRSTPDREESTRMLNYLMVELEMLPPGDSPWSAFARIHHRSGVFGLFGNVSGGSNFIGMGLRYRW